MNSIIVYDSLPSFNQFVNAVSAEIAGPRFEEFVKPVFKALTIIKGYSPHAIGQRAEDDNLSTQDPENKGCQRTLQSSCRSVALTMSATRGLGLSWSMMSWPCLSSLFG